MPLVTLFFNVTSVTYVALCHASGHLLIYRECYGFERAFLLSGVFLPCTPSCFLKGFPGDDNSTSKSAGFHDDLQNIVLARLFVWKTVIHKRFICGRFYLTTRAGQVRNIKFSRELVVRNISFDISASYGVWALFAIGEYLRNFILYPFGRKV